MHSFLTISKLSAFQQVLTESERKPQILMSDNGSEFISRSFRALLSKYEIKQSLAEPGDHHRMGLVERFNKTLRGKLVKYMTAYKTKRFVDGRVELLADRPASRLARNACTPAWHLHELPAHRVYSVLSVPIQRRSF